LQEAPGAIEAAITAAGAQCDARAHPVTG